MLACGPQPLSDASRGMLAVSQRASPSVGCQLGPTWVPAGANLGASWQLVFECSRGRFTIGALSDAVLLRIFSMVPQSSVQFPGVGELLCR